MGSRAREGVASARTSHGRHSQMLVYLGEVRERPGGAGGVVPRISVQFRGDLVSAVMIGIFWFSPRALPYVETMCVCGARHTRGAVPRDVACVWRFSCHVHMHMYMCMCMHMHMCMHV